MSDVNLALTTAGQALKAKIEAGEGKLPLDITRIVTGAGTSFDPLNLTEVVDFRQEFSITGRVTTGARTSISALLSNYGNPDAGIAPLLRGYPLSQIGFYANDPDDGEILYRISQFDAPNWVPAMSERGWMYEPTFNIITGNASEVVVHIDPSGFPTRRDIYNSAEYSGSDAPNPGTRIHYFEEKEEPAYVSVSDALHLFSKAGLVEMRMLDDPGNPSTSPFTVMLPITVLEAVFHPKTRQNLIEILGMNAAGLIEINSAEPIPASESANVGMLTQLMGRLAYMIKQLSGNSAWWQTPSSNIEDMLRDLQQLAAQVNKNNDMSDAMLGGSYYGATYLTGVLPSA